MGDFWVYHSTFLLRPSFSDLPQIPQIAVQQPALSNTTMLALKKLVLVAACVACALGASASAAAPQQRHLRSVAIERATTETFALIAKDSDEDGDEDSAVESTDDGAATMMETFPLAIESDKYQWQDEPPSAFTEEYSEDEQRDADDNDEEEDNESPGTDDDDDTEDDDESVSDEVDTVTEGDNDSEDSVEDSDSIEDAANDAETPDGDDDEEEDGTTADLTIDIEITDAN